MLNIHQNPLPNYQRVPPPNQLNFIEEEEFVFAVDDKVWTDFYKLANENSSHSTRTRKHFKPPHLEVEHPRREDLEREVPNVKSVEKVGKGKGISKPEEEEDAILGALAEKEVLMTISLVEVLSIIGVENTRTVITFTDKDLPPDGPVNATVMFHVLKIPTSYNLLLGRAWMHPLGIVPSTHHQQLRLPWKDRILTILGDWEISTDVCE
uniref:Uncharacterized protein n=1 Tax=Fagus sylvatica TaxID=28930 RepID=A0A2N9FS11_FAGSY